MKLGVVFRTEFVDDGWDSVTYDVDGREVSRTRDVVREYDAESVPGSGTAPDGQRDINADVSDRARGTGGMAVAAFFDSELGTTTPGATTVGRLVQRRVRTFKLTPSPTLRRLRLLPLVSAKPRAVRTSARPRERRRARPAAEHHRAALAI